MRIRIHPSFCVHLVFMAYLSSYKDCIGMIAALLIHEAFHYAAARLIGMQIAQLELTPFGGVMRWKPGTISCKGLKGVFVHAAGPTANYVLLWVLGTQIAQRMLDAALLRSLIMANASMLILNLLPALPLDGGQIVFCIGYYLFPVARLAGFLSALGVAVGISGLLLFLYGMVFRQMLNCSLLIVSLYLIVIAIQSRRSLLSENIYAVIQERLTDLPQITRIVHYYAAPETALYEIIPLLKPNTQICIAFTEGYRMIRLTEPIICQALLTMPSATIRKAWQQISQYQEKKPDKC